MLKLEDVKLAVVGLGYVGLPLAVEFGKKNRVVSFDISKTRVDALKSGRNAAGEVSTSGLKSVLGLIFSSVLGETAGFNVFIVTLPSSIVEHKRSHLTTLIDVLAEGLSTPEILTKLSTETALQSNKFEGKPPRKKTGPSCLLWPNAQKKVFAR